MPSWCVCVRAPRTKKMNVYRARIVRRAKPQPFTEDAIVREPKKNSKQNIQIQPSSEVGYILFRRVCMQIENGTTGNRNIHIVVKRTPRAAVVKPPSTTSPSHTQKLSAKRIRHMAICLLASSNNHTNRMLISIFICF